jgi:hypothetical protein
MVPKFLEITHLITSRYVSVFDLHEAKQNADSDIQKNKCGEACTR